MLDTLKSGSFNVFVKNQINNDVHGYVVSDTVIASAAIGSDAVIVDDIHIGVGFGVARFDEQGDARASECGTSDKEIPTLFVCVAY